VEGGGEVGKVKVEYFGEELEWVEDGAGGGFVSSVVVGHVYIDWWICSCCYSCGGYRHAAGQCDMRPLF